MKWNPDLPIGKLPKEISEIFSQEAKYLIKDLEINKLEVALIPAPSPQFIGHMIRVTINHNPEWYKTFYHSYKHVKRRRCINALKRISENQDRALRVKPYLYDSRMRTLIFEKIYNTGCYDDAILKINDPKEDFDITKRPIFLLGVSEKDYEYADVPF